MQHDLKIWPQYFRPVAERVKTFEVRENDRGFQARDVVRLREWDPTPVEKEEELPIGQVHSWTEPRGYTGQELTFSIGYVLPIDEKRVVFSLIDNVIYREKGRDEK